MAEIQMAAGSIKGDIFIFIEQMIKVYGIYESYGYHYGWIYMEQFYQSRPWCLLKFFLKNCKVKRSSSKHGDSLGTDIIVIEQEY